MSDSDLLARVAKLFAIALHHQKRHDRHSDRLCNLEYRVAQLERGQGMVDLHLTIAEAKALETLLGSVAVLNMPEVGEETKCAIVDSLKSSKELASIHRILTKQLVEATQ